MRRQGPSTASEQLLLPHPLQNATKQQQQQHLQGASKIFMKKRWILLSISLAIGWTFWLLQKQTITILPPFATTTSTTTTTTQSSQQYTFEFLQVAKAAISAAAVATKAADVSSSNTTPNIIEPFTINATTTTTSRCFSWNSKEWLQGPRLSNARNSMPLSWIHDNFQSSILSHVLSSTDGRNLPDHPNRNETNILDQTLCHPQGRFRSATKFLPPLQQQQQQSYLSILDDWEFRLLYLAIHRLHHQPAMAEYQLRVQHDCFSDSDTSTGLNDNNESHGGKTTTTTTPLQPQLLPPHPYEYECPNAKYLVTALPTLGMGAALRLGAVPAIFMALTTERIPLFIMHAGAEQPFTTTKNRNRNQTQPRLLPDFVTSPWPLASCGGGQNMTFSSSFHHFYHQRQDLQCVFLPTSPCVLTQDMLDQAVLLPETQARTWRRSGILDSKLQSEPVLLVEARTAPAKFDEYRILYTLRQQTFRLVQELIQEWDKESSLSYMNATVKAQWKTHFQRVAKRIQQGAPPPSLPTTQNQSLGGSRHHSYFTYGHRDFRLAHAALLYVLRPNYPSMQRIQQQVQRALQTTPLSTKSSTDKARTLNTNSRHNNATDSNADNIIWIGLPIRGKSNQRGGLRIQHKTVLSLICMILSPQVLISAKPRVPAFHFHNT
jgi:hypothetical protein